MQLLSSPTVEYIVVPALVSLGVGLFVGKLAKFNWIWTTTLSVGSFVIAIGLVYFVEHRPAIKDGTVAGMVVEEGTLRPIPGAYVTIINRKESQTTDSNGNFHLVLMPPFPELVRVHVSAAGYADNEFGVWPPQTSTPLPLEKVRK